MDRDPITAVLNLGARLGCLICPGASDLRLYGGWQAILHEIGHFAIAPEFLWDKRAYVEAVEQGERPPVPGVGRFAVGVRDDGSLIPEGIALVGQNDGEILPYVAAIGENPLPLTDWHVRAWTKVAAEAIGLTEPSSLWLQTSPWSKLLGCVDWELDYRSTNAPKGWALRHEKTVNLWRNRAATFAIDTEQEMQWRLEDLGLADGIRCLEDLRNLPIQRRRNL